MTREEIRNKMYEDLKYVNTDTEVIGKVFQEIQSIDNKDLMEQKRKYLKHSEISKKRSIQYMEQLDIRYAHQTMIEYAVDMVMVDLVDCIIEDMED